MTKALKIGGILVCLTLLTNTVHAQDHPADGLYFGVDGSYDMLKDNFDIRDSTTPTNLGEYNGTAAGGFFGYRQSKGDFTVAVEARYGYGFANFTNVAVGSTLKHTHEFELAALPGYWVNDTLLVYARLAATNNTTRVNVTNNTTTETTTNFNYGGGLEIRLSDGFSVRAEYTRSEVYGAPFTAGTTWRIKRDRFKGAIVKQF